MTFPGILLLILLPQASVTLELIIFPTQRTYRGSNVVLGCSYLVDGPSVNPADLIIKWQFKRNEIMTYSNESQSLRPRMSFNAQAVRSGDASLYISNLTILDDGTYTCSVMYKTERKEKNIQLQIMASPNVIITNRVVTENKPSAMACTATKFYPPDIRITWLRDNQLLQNSELGEITLNADQTFSVQSTVTITPTDDDRDRIFSCKVQHTSLLEPLRRDFHLDIQKDGSVGLIAGIVSGLVIVILAAAALGIFCCMRQRSEPHTEQIEPDPSEVHLLHPLIEQLPPPTEHLVIKDIHVEDPSQQEADVKNGPDNIANDCPAPTDQCLPHAEESSVEELDEYEMIDRSELSDYP